MAFLWGGSSATAWDGLVGSMTGSPMAHITAPVANELVVQSLLKRQVSSDATCGFSSTGASNDFYGCNANEACYYQPGSTQNLLSCCNPATTGSCSIGRSACVGSTQSISMFGSLGCPAYSTICCTDSNAPDCLTALLPNDDGRLYTMFWCARSYPATVILTPMDKLITTSSSTTASVPLSSVTSQLLSTPSAAASTSESSSSTTAAAPSTSESSSSTTAAAASASNSTSPEAQQQPTESSAEKHKGAIIGGVVGGVVALLAVAAGFFVLHRINVKKREAGGGDDAPEMSGRVPDGMTYT